MGKVACSCITTWQCRHDCWITVHTGRKNTQSASWLQCLMALAATMEGDSGFLFSFSLFLFFYFGSRRLKVIQSGGCLHCCLCKHGGRHKAQENRSMAAEQEQHEPPRLISPSGAPINSYCSGRRWYIVCIRRPGLVIPPFFHQSNRI